MLSSGSENSQELEEWNDFFDLFSHISSKGVVFGSDEEKLVFRLKTLSYIGVMIQKELSYAKLCLYYMYVRVGLGRIKNKNLSNVKA